MIAKFKKIKRPLIITEISGNHNGSKKSFLNHIISAANNGADMIKIQTYEPQDITLKNLIKILKLKMVPGKVNIYGIYTLKLTLLINGIRMLLN